MTNRSLLGRAAVLARMAGGLPLVRAALRAGLVCLAAAGAGLAACALVAGTATARAGMAGPAIAGIVAAAVAGAAAHAALHRRDIREQASEFSHMARRVGETKTALSESRAAIRRLARAIERAVPEVLAEDDSDSSARAFEGSVGALDPFGETGRERDQHLARRLLRIARAASFYAGNDLELKRLAFAGPCAEVLEQYRRFTGPDREILYMEDGGGEWLAAPMDRPLFVLVLRELLDNVFEHGGDWNRITVTTEPVPGAILVRVRDDGRGIPPDALRGIMAGGPSGFRGLGLPIARAVVEAHGGSFRVDSEVGRGTSVNLKFPTHA